jgi:hypothetical protein
MAPRKPSSASRKADKPAKSLKTLKPKDTTGVRGGKRTTVRDAHDKYA